MLDIVALSKSFATEPGAPGAKPVLDGIGFSVPQNQFVCVLGPSGCGKTTLLRIVAGLTPADAGIVRLDGRAVVRPGQDRSMVFQNYGLLPWRTVMGNVEFGLEVRGVPRAKRRAVCAAHIARVGLAGYEEHYPHQISGGMQQRVALARAFSKDPRLLLMDEPFAAVDMQTRELLQDELLRIWSEIKTTVLFVTHSIDEAIYLGDRVIMLAGGRITADVEIGLPRPRTEAMKSLPRFNELRHLLRCALRPAAMATAA